MRIDFRLSTGVIFHCYPSLLLFSNGSDGSDGELIAADVVKSICPATFFIDH